jgi:hypothetical protein
MSVVYFATIVFRRRKWNDIWNIFWRRNKKNWIWNC